MRLDYSELTMSEGLELYYEDVPFTGESVDLGEDDELLELNRYRNGHEEGLQQGWYADGGRRYEYWIINDRLCGYSYDWHPNGQLARRQLFNRFGEMTKHEHWAEDGSVEPY
ncbi:MAG TPA: hypothetical protein VHW44_04620 [Pseudonocardiaceae bacterium]|jgi:antitoxin component YwqK of YwqJK toxin-antitoxin module|nr:hypothetical protein [Pseudonocardiaceae bacterium]